MNAIHVIREIYSISIFSFPVHSLKFSLFSNTFVKNRRDDLNLKDEKKHDQKTHAHIFTEFNVTSWADH